MEEAGALEKTAFHVSDTFPMWSKYNNIFLRIEAATCPSYYLPDVSLKTEQSQ